MHYLFNTCIQTYNSNQFVGYVYGLHESVLIRPLYLSF